MKSSASIWFALSIVALFGCRERRVESDEVAPVFADVAPILERKCSTCHGAKAPAGDYRLTSFLDTTRCTSGGQLATQPRNERAPLLAVLSRPDHASLLSAQEAALLSAWVRAGAPQSRSVIHPVGILDPRSPAWHGTLAATGGWAPLHDPGSKLVCGRCHAGSPVQPSDVTASVPNAPSCTSCHDDEAGVLACGTCHGEGKRAYPPRDNCLFEVPSRDAHRAHLEGTHFREEPLACNTCHDVPSSAQLFTGLHANGSVDIRFESALTDGTASYDDENQRCSVGCHTRGGTQAEPSWDSTQELDCNGCHQSPPDSHYPGQCGTCHDEMGKTATSLRVGPLHLNGKIDLGDGGDTCSACHGAGKAGWPTDASHRAHRDTTLTRAVNCEECHSVPDEVVSAGHLDGELTLSFTGRALAATATPRFDPDTRTCSEVACHGTKRGGGEIATPRWGDAFAEPERCSACHATPPPPPHTQRAGCGGGLCHGDELAPLESGFRITESGRASHLDGVVATGGGTQSAEAEPSTSSTGE